MAAEKKGSGRYFKYCSDCGAKVSKKAEICPQCGVRQDGKSEGEEGGGSGAKNPALAAVLSFLFTGLGQIYNGEIGKGIMFIIVYIVLWTISVFTLFICIPGPILFWLYGIYDAYEVAKKK
ncbi:MAG: hypothetical protein ABIH83_01645 [Candidatus Micrarchaeota archaeon]